MDLHFGGNRQPKMHRKTFDDTKLFLYIFVNQFHDGCRGYFQRRLLKKKSEPHLVLCFFIGGKKG